MRMARILLSLMSLISITLKLMAFYQALIRHTSLCKSRVRKVHQKVKIKAKVRVKEVSIKRLPRCKLNKWDPNKLPILNSNNMSKIINNNLHTIIHQTIWIWISQLDTTMDPMETWLRLKVDMGHTTIILTKMATKPPILHKCSTCRIPIIMDIIQMTGITFRGKETSPFNSIVKEIQLFGIS